MLNVDSKMESMRKVLFPSNDHNDDKVSEALLEKLENDEIKSLLENPHLRAILEDLVSTENPEQMMADAMREPIFTEFADACLKIVDQDNPNLEPEGVS